MKSKRHSVRALLLSAGSVQLFGPFKYGLWRPAVSAAYGYAGESAYCRQALKLQIARVGLQPLFEHHQNPDHGSIVGGMFVQLAIDEFVDKFRRDDAAGFQGD